jgi:hypothetical protein
MVALRQGLFARRETPSQRAIVSAFKVGAKVHKKNGVSANLREAVRLYKESLKSE